MQLTLDFTESTRRKEQGQSAALSAAGEDWKAEATRIVLGMRGEFRMESVREQVEALGLFPKSSNAWGALTGALAREGLIVWTGRYENARAKLTHAHPVRLWRLK